MFTDKRAKIFGVVFIIGALGRSVAGGLGFTRVASLLGLVASFTLLYGGLYNFLAPTIEDKLFRPLQRFVGLVLIALWLIFSVSFMMELRVTP
jgi:hypothetical protein